MPQLTQILRMLFQQIIF